MISGKTYPRPYSRIAEKGCSRKLGFRCKEFSETQVVPLLILRAPICRGNPMRCGLGICTNARANFRCMRFSETELPIRGLLVSSEGVKGKTKAGLTTFVGGGNIGQPGMI